MPKKPSKRDQSATPPPPEDDPRALAGSMPGGGMVASEQAFAKMDRFLAGQECSSLEEMNAALQRFVTEGQFTDLPPLTPLDQAQERPGINVTAAGSLLVLHARSGSEHTEHTICLRRGVGEFRRRIVDHAAALLDLKDERQDAAVWSARRSCQAFTGQLPLDRVSRSAYAL
jgi:hypothetical protein